MGIVGKILLNMHLSNEDYLRLKREEIKVSREYLITILDDISKKLDVSFDLRDNVYDQGYIITLGFSGNVCSFGCKEYWYLDKYMEKTFECLNELGVIKNVL